MAERAEPTLYNRREVDPRRAQVPQAGGPANLADILERVLDKGIVIAGDIQINLLDIELLTIKLRLLIASVDRAREMGINWWEGDPSLQALGPGDQQDNGGNGDQERLERENRELRERLDRLEERVGRG
jgi:hypothetical protein